MCCGNHRELSTQKSLSTWNLHSVSMSGAPAGSDGKESARSTGDLDLIPGSGRFPGEGNGYPL